MPLKDASVYRAKPALKKIAALLISTTNPSEKPLRPEVCGVNRITLVGTDGGVRVHAELFLHPATQHHTLPYDRQEISELQFAGKPIPQAVHAVARKLAGQGFDVCDRPTGKGPGFSVLRLRRRRTHILIGWYAARAKTAQTRKHAMTKPAHRRAA